MGNGLGFALFLGTSTYEPQTLTGRGIYQSYASLSLNNQTLLESTVGKTFELFSGGSPAFGGILVASAPKAVPEPSSLAMGGLGVVLTGLTAYRRRARG